MKSIIMTAAALAAITAGAATPADAAQGCGPGFHRGYYGYCRPNAVPAVYGPPRVGFFYPGHGYWYGGRYWAHRYAWGGGWRYR